MKNLNVGWCVVIICLGVYVSISCYAGKAQWPESLVTSSGLVVSAATLTSVVFAVFSFYEHRNLVTKMAELKKELRDEHDSAKRHIEELRAEFLSSSSFVYRDLCDVIFANLSDSPEFQNTIKEISLSMARLNLQISDIDKQKNALSVFFKHNKREFLRMESVVVSKARRLPPSECSELIKQYKTLKELIIKEIPGMS
jgi:hypothetical protein